MNTAEAERHIKDQLNGVYEEQEAANIASLGIEFITGLSKAERLSKKEHPLTADQIQKLDELTERLRSHEPVQYIMNKT